LACGSCGAQCHPAAKFCSECGTRLTPAGPSAEYKQVTVLFVDVVHSMDIAAAVGDERLREIMADLTDTCRAVIEHFGGTVGSFTGDGIMAVFGAPAALDDHAVRACRAASAIQKEVRSLEAEAERADGIELKLRVGLNSGEVIAGEIGSRSLGYTAMGEQVGLAQRMESVAPPGGVMLSASTARLVDSSVALAEAEWVRIKGAEEPVRAYRLLGIGERRLAAGRAESSLVGRRREMAAVDGLLTRAVDGQGAVVGVVGHPGVGKSRLVRELAAMARQRGVGVFTAFCESHAGQIPFHTVARLLRAVTGVENLDAPAARDHLRHWVSGADPEDLLLLDDLLGIGDPAAAVARIDPDARRRRLTALVNNASLARDAPAVVVVEDVHWIDEVSESMLSEFFTIIPRTPSLVVVTYRPEYAGALTQVPGAETIALSPLSEAATAALVSELVGPDPSLGTLGQTIADRAAGNPFFAEEMVQDLAERGVLRGNRNAYVSTVGSAEVSVPATVQATIAARIDRLDPAAKRTLSAAAVIGARFGLDLLAATGIEPRVDDLVVSELIDPVAITGEPEYVFHHPLVRTVAYAAQLKSDRAELHRRVATAIETRDPTSTEENAALIAEHLQTAGDLGAAYGWHLRAAAWAANRDIGAARLSWQRAAEIADALPADAPHRAAMSIAPRTMLCATAHRVDVDSAGEHFDELEQLCAAVGDKASLAIATAGLLMDHAWQDRIFEANRLASEVWTLVEAVDDATLTVGLSVPVLYAKIECAEWSEVLRWSQRVIDLADGDPSKGDFLFGSPLALALTTRAWARYWLGHPGWRDDQRRGLAMARSAEPVAYVTVVTYVYPAGIPNGVLRPDDSAMREIEEAVRIAERSGDDVAVNFARATLGLALVHRNTEAERDHGQTLLAEVLEVSERRRHNLADRPLIVAYSAREQARRGDREEALPLMRAAVDHLFRERRLLVHGIAATGVLVETLLDHGDLTDAEAAINRLAAAPADDGLVLRDIWLVRLRTLLARARGDEEAYRRGRDRYRAMAVSLEFEGHLAMAEAMT
jgi:class 3 adenylate cyclase